ncbi:related to Phosphatidylglycerol/phosphatidylinositol transfer protein [Zygosaccharomyces bailii ISA1307]|nr:related to Phosphatidylglycerol/phosphatidylinositol transfer protein [Zygosaccharomyces bailii ISA1307]
MSLRNPMLSFLTLLTVFSTAWGNLISFNNHPLDPHELINKPIPGGSPVYKCDIVEKQLLEITSVELSPNPPQRGQNLTIVASGELFEELVEGAYVDVEVRLGYIRLLAQTFDLCETLDENDVEGLKCPVQPGVYNLEKEVSIPAEVPPGKYVFVARAYTVADDLISCVTGEVFFPAGQVKL